MTTDWMQTNELRHVRRSYLLKKASQPDVGFELTRHENFLNGEEDIFDVLQSQRKANKSQVSLVGWQRD